MKKNQYAGSARLLCLFGLLFASMPVAFALDVPIIRLDILLPNETAQGVEYLNLFKLTNLNHTSGVTSSVSVKVDYEFTKESVVYYNGSFSKTINSFSSSGTGKVNFTQGGVFVLCGRSNLADAVCKEIKVNATEPAIPPVPVLNDTGNSNIPTNETPANTTVNATVPMNDTTPVNETIPDNESVPTGNSSIPVNDTIPEPPANATVNSTVNETLPETNSTLPDVNETAPQNESIPNNNTTDDGSCSVPISVSLDKAAFLNHEQVVITSSLGIPAGKSYSFVIEYWVEYQNGSVAKKKLNTTNLNEKSFTPSIASQDEAFIVKNRLAAINCTNTNSITESNVSFTVHNPDYVPPENITENTTGAPVEEDPEENSSTPQEDPVPHDPEEVPSSPTAKVLSLYTRSKNFNESINLYSTVLAKNGGLAVLSGGGVDEIRQLPADSKNQALSFNIRASHGKVEYKIELYEGSVLADSRILELDLVEKKSSGKASSAPGQIKKTNETKANATKQAPKHLNTTKTVANTTVKNETRPVIAVKQASSKTPVFSEPAAEQVEDSQASIEVHETAPTAMAVYESPKARSWLAIPFAVAGVFALVIIGLLVKNRDKFK